MLSLSDLIKSLPRENQTEKARTARQFIARFAGKNGGAVPTYTAQRMRTMGALQATIAVSYLSCWVHGWFENANENQNRIKNAQLESALQLLEKMSYLRGAIMKVGQLLASYPEIVPDAFVSALRRLHFEAPPMHFSLLEECFRAQLGKRPEEIFETFETRAFAAASLGQVHRARLKTGERVAVKIQYPGIADAIRADFRALRILLSPLRLNADWENLKAQLVDLEAHLVAETDYVREAETMATCRALFEEGADAIVIPKTYPEFCTEKIITMDYLEGRSLADFLESRPSKKARENYADKICRFSLRFCLGTRNLYADPNPGNYVILENGKLGILDFGCVRRYNEDEWQSYGQFARAVLARDEAACHVAVTSFFDSNERAGGDPEYEELMNRICVWNTEPLLSRKRFNFADVEYLKNGIANVYALVGRRYTRGQPCNILATRMYFGNAAIYLQLGATVAASAIFREEVARVPDVFSDEGGRV